MILRQLQIPRNAQLKEIELLSAKLANHPLYHSVKTPADVRVYLEYQVWCVWDFMALLKAVQTHFLSSSVNWIPPVDAMTGHYIYDMLMSEETDIDETGGRRSSHFETYLRAMSQAKADRTAIDRFVSALRKGKKVEAALALAKPPAASKDFVNVTLKIARGPIHGAVAAFCLSREGIIPDMFTTFLRNLAVKEKFSIFEWYLRRHVAVDSESHGPASAQLFEHIVGKDKKKLAESLSAVQEALTARLVFLDKICKALPSGNHKR